MQDSNLSRPGSKIIFHITSLNYHQNVALNVLPGNKCTFYRDKNVQEIEDILTKEFSILCEFGNNFVDNK